MLQQFIFVDKMGMIENMFSSLLNIVPTLDKSFLINSQVSVQTISTRLMKIDFLIYCSLLPCTG